MRDVVAKAIAKALWNRRLFHIDYRHLCKASFWTGGIPADPAEANVPICELCIKGKLHEFPFSEKVERAFRVSQIVHSNVAWPLPPSYISVYRYTAKFTNDRSRHTTAALTKRKSQLHIAFHQYERQLGGLVEQNSVEVNELHTADADVHRLHLQRKAGLRMVRLHAYQST